MDMVVKMEERGELGRSRPRWMKNIEIVLHEKDVCGL
jgi:hypothetical protein